MALQAAMCSACNSLPLSAPGNLESQYLPLSHVSIALVSHARLHIAQGYKDISCLTYPQHAERCLHTRRLFHDHAQIGEQV